MIVALSEFTIRLNEVEIFVNKIQRRVATIKVDTEEVKQECSTEQDSDDARR